MTSITTSNCAARSRRGIRAFFEWWNEVGPEGFDTSTVYLRTAISASADGWANYGYVKMPEYRWGIFLAPPENRKIGFGDNPDADPWQQVPGEFRKELRRIIVTQGDTEPASVEQQRHLGKTAPSLYDLRNLFQVNVEEARHLWAMVYLLHRFFGRDGREEAEELLTRRSGHRDHPRILTAFNAPIRDWLDFYCFAMFTDRDGKYQLESLSESGFDPLSRTTRFMLTEEAHHMFVGETGVQRVVQRTADLMKQSGRADIHALGGIELAVIQKYINLWYSESLDLFGAEDSSNAATYFATGIKGRYREHTANVYREHRALEGEYELRLPGGARRADSAAPRDERGPARRLRAGLRARACAMEPRAGRARPRPAPRAAARRLQSQGRSVRGAMLRPARKLACGRGIRGTPRRMAADRGGSRAQRRADAAGIRAGQDRGMDRAAGQGHQRPAAGFRVRDPELAAVAWRARQV